MTPILRPATAADVAAFTKSAYGQDQTPPMRIRAFVGEIHGRVIALGGIVFHPDGTRMAFADLTDEARAYPIALHKAALETLKLAGKLRIRRLVATTASGHPAAERWLLRLGFRPVTTAGATVYVCDLSLS